MEDKSINIFGGLEKYHDRQEILEAIIAQLEKDTGLDYTQTPIDANDPVFLENLRMDLAAYLKKIAGQNQTRFMHLIYRVDISQTKMNRLEMDEFYYHKLSELVLNRMFQKIMTRKLFS